MTPYFYLDTVQSSFVDDPCALAMALYDPGLLLRGAHVASEIFIWESERSTFSPRPPNFENDPTDLLPLVSSVGFALFKGCLNWGKLKGGVFKDFVRIYCDYTTSMSENMWHKYLHGKGKLRWISDALAYWVDAPSLLDCKLELGIVYWASAVLPLCVSLVVCYYVFMKQYF